MSRHVSSQDVFCAIGDPTRRALLDRLAQGEQSVGELAERFQITLSAISQQLKVLHQAKLVAVRREGRQRIYRLDARPLVRVNTWVARYEQFWHNKLDALEGHLRATPHSANKSRQ